MATVGFWNEDAIDKVPDFVLVRQSNIDDFLQFVRGGALPSPQKIFVVAPNGYGLEDLLSFYVVGQSVDWDLAAVYAADPGLSDRFSVWHNLAASLARLDRISISTWIEEFSRSASAHQTRAAKVVALLRSYVGLCVQPLLDIGLFRTIATPQSVLWWRVADVYGASLTKFRKQAALDIASMPSLEVLDAAAALAAKPWTSMAGKPTEDKFFDLSAYCFGLGERYFSLGHSQWAFLLAYRALDLYFHSLALREDVIIEKADGLGYPSSTKDLYLVDLEYQLFQKQVLAPSDTRRLFIVGVNDMRNQLLLTHGAHHVTDQEAKDMLAGVEGLIVGIEGSAKWRQRSGTFFPRVNDGLRFLFESVPDIQTFIEDRTALMQAAEE